MLSPEAPLYYRYIRAITPFRELERPLNRAWSRVSQLPGHTLSENQVQERRQLLI